MGVIFMMLDFAIISQIWNVKHRAQKRTKIHKLDFIRIKNFWLSRDSIKRLERQRAECKKKSVNHVSSKGLIAKIKDSCNSRTTKHKHG